MAEDQELWERTRAGDAEAFGDLYERHARTVQSYCLWRIAVVGADGRILTATDPFSAPAGSPRGGRNDTGPARPRTIIVFAEHLGIQR
jgi:hypothetical protein